jgi:hypothetical protein
MEPLQGWERPTGPEASPGAVAFRQLEDAPDGAAVYILVPLFRQYLLDGLPIILREPSVRDQFDNPHKEGVAIVSA